MRVLCLNPPVAPIQQCHCDPASVDENNSDPIKIVGNQIVTGQSPESGVPAASAPTQRPEPEVTKGPAADPSAPTAGSSILESHAFERSLGRYEALVNQWTHRDATMHQWPPLMISATGALLAIVFGQGDKEELKSMSNPSSWGPGHNIGVWLGVGIPLLVGGLALMPLLYAMSRAIRVMNNIAEEVNAIEQTDLGCPPDHAFIFLNHPEGWSARRLIIRTMTAMSVLLVLAGCELALGIYAGTCVFSLIATTSWLYLRSGHRPPDAKHLRNRVMQPNRRSLPRMNRRV
jgi:hypothetical protein